MHDDPEILRMQQERVRSMSIEERARLVDDLTEAVEELARAGIRDAFPQADEREVFLRLAIRKLGYVDARRVYPEIEGLEGGAA